MSNLHLTPLTITSRSHYWKRRNTLSTQRECSSLLHLWPLWCATKTIVMGWLFLFPGPLTESLFKSTLHFPKHHPEWIKIFAPHELNLPHLRELETVQVKGSVVQCSKQICKEKAIYRESKWGRNTVICTKVSPRVFAFSVKDSSAFPIGQTPNHEAILCVTPSLTPFL